MMWIPVSREKFESILVEEVQSLTPEVFRIYQRYVVSPYQQFCLRNMSLGTELVFVVGKVRTYLLFYDDVEEDFGVEIPDSDGVLRNWGTYGSLAQAVLVLDKSACASPFS